MASARLDEIAASVCASFPGRARPGSLGAFDSIARLELILAVEQAYGIELEEEELAGIETLEALDALVEVKRAAQDAAPRVRPSAEPEAPRAPVRSLPRFYRPARALLLWATRCLFRIRVSGREFIPSAGPCLLCANHSSHLDSLAILASVGPRRADLVFPAARDYFFGGRWLGAVGKRMLPLIPFERGGHLGALKENLRQLEACRDGGRVIVLFPEGSRSENGELGRFKDGLAFFAERLRLPVTPCWITGTFRALPRGAVCPRPGTLRVAFGPPVPWRGGADGFSETVRRAMLALRA